MIIQTISKFQVFYIVAVNVVFRVPTSTNNFYFLGNYWIDPNGGVRNDAVLAYCHLESQSSCVLPKNVEVSM